MIEIKYVFTGLASSGTVKTVIVIQSTPEVTYERSDQISIELDEAFSRSYAQGQVVITSSRIMTNTKHNITL